MPRFTPRLTESPTVVQIVMVFALTASACVSLAGAAPPAFSNQTVAAGINVSHTTAGFIQFQYTGGGAIGDFNRDGWMDFFMISGGSNGAPDFLFINNRDGTFTNRAAEWDLTAVHRGKSACAGDFDGDGWTDLYVTSAGVVGQSTGPGKHRLYRNNGNGTFTEMAAAAGVAFADPTVESAWTSVFGDYDLDGDLDLFVGGFAGSPSNTEHHLFRNNGDSTFTDVTATIGLFSGVGNVAALSARFIDMNDDRYPELLIGGDFKGSGSYIGSRYFKNNGNGTFTDATTSSNTGKEENGMGQTILDVDNDGRIDWYVTSIYSPSSGWTGNKLYRSTGAHVFAEIASAAGAQQGGYGWGTVGADFNHDGWEDIAETGGDASSNSPFYNIPARLWMNQGNMTFVESAATAGFDFVQKGRSLLRFDADNDGDQDVLIFRFNGPLTFLRNDLVQAGDTAWLRVFLDTNGHPGFAPQGIGCRVTVRAGSQARHRMMDCGVSYLGTSEVSAHFGLASAAVADEVIVHWPDGSLTTLQNVALNRTLTIAPDGLICDSDLDHDGDINGTDLALVLGSWGSVGVPGFPGDANRDGIVDGEDIATVLGTWGGCR